jgi:hypothetical protein
MNQRRVTFSAARLILWAIALWSLSLARETRALAEDPIRVQANEHGVSFGQELRFHLEAEADAPITSIVLAYRTSDTRGTTVETLVFNPATKVSVDHVHEIERRYVRPFVDVSYWWTIVDATQARTVTAPQQFRYADDRFDWQTRSDGNINVHWYDGDIQVAQQALDIAADGMSRARQDIQVEAVQPLDIYFYANVDDLGPALPPNVPPDMEALTLNEMNVILTLFSPEATHIPVLKRVLPHEVTHALIHQATQSDYDRVPMWLAEGLATSVQHTFAPDADAQALVEETARQPGTISLQDMCATFPEDTADARLAYAKSASVVDFIRDRYGRQGLRDLVAAYVDGASCEGGVYRVLGTTLDGLESKWQASLAPQGILASFWDQSGAYLILILVIALPLLLFILPSRARSKVLRDESL